MNKIFARTIAGIEQDREKEILVTKKALSQS